MSTFYGTQKPAVELINKIVRLTTASHDGYQNFRSTHKIKTK